MARGVKGTRQPTPPSAPRVKKWRDNPENHAIELKRQVAWHEALVRLHRLHKEEFAVIYNEVLAERQLKPYYPRGTKRTKTAAEKVSADLDPDVAHQGHCPHNQGLRKTKFGKLCVMCEKRIT